MMQSLIDKSSDPVSLSELDLFSIPPTQVAVVNQRYREIHPTNPIQDAGPFNFRVLMDKNNLQLSKNYLYVKFKITDLSGADIPVDLANSVKNDRISPIQALGATFISQIKCYINNVLVEDTGNLYPYRSMLELDWNHDKLTKISNLKPSLYAYTEGNLGTSTDNGYEERFQATKGSKEFETFAPLHLSLFQQERLMPNMIDLNLHISRCSDAFLLKRFENTNPALTGFKLKIKDIKLYIKEYTLNDSVSLGLEKTLMSGHLARYPLKVVKMANFHIPGGSVSSPQSTIFSQVLPKRILVGLVNTKALFGDHTKDPFKFENFDLKNISLEVGGKIIPHNRLELDYTNGHYMHAYYQTLDALGYLGRNKTCSISPKMFKDGGFNIYAFDVSTACDDRTFDFVTPGVTRISLTFNTYLPVDGCSAIVLGEFDQLLNIDSTRTPFTDTSSVK